MPTRDPFGFYSSSDNFADFSTQAQRAGGRLSSPRSTRSSGDKLFDIDAVTKKITQGITNSLVEEAITPVLKDVFPGYGETKKQREKRQAAAEEQKRGDLVQSIVDQAMSQPFWNNSSPERKREILQGYREGAWDAWARERFGNDEASRSELETAVFDELETRIRNEEDEAYTFANWWDSLGMAASSGLDQASRMWTTGQLAWKTMIEGKGYDHPEVVALLDELKAKQEASNEKEREWLERNKRYRIQRLRTEEWEEDTEGTNMPSFIPYFAENPSTIPQYVLQQWPQALGSIAGVLGTQAGVTAATRAAGAALSLVAPPVGAAVSAAAPAVGALAGRAGGVGFGAAASSAGGIDEMSQAIWDLSDDDLKQMPRYQEFAARGLDNEGIRRAMIVDAAVDAGPYLSAIGGIGSLFGFEQLFGSRLFNPARKIVEGATKSLAGRAAVGAGVSAVEEALSEGAESVAQNYGFNQATGSTDSIFEGIGNDMVLGALVGGLLGGVGGSIQGRGKIIKKIDESEDKGTDDRTVGATARVEATGTQAANRRLGEVDLDTTVGAARGQTAPSQAAGINQPGMVDLVRPQEGADAAPAYGGERLERAQLATDHLVRAGTLIEEAVASSKPLVSDTDLAPFFQHLASAKNFGASDEAISTQLGVLQNFINQNPNATLDVANEFQKYMAQWSPETDVNIEDEIGTVPEWDAPQPAPQGGPQPQPQPAPQPTPQGGPQPQPAPQEAAPQGGPQPQPAPQPAPQETAPQGGPQPTPQPAPDPTESTVPPGQPIDPEDGSSLQGDPGNTPAPDNGTPGTPQTQVDPNATPEGSDLGATPPVGNPNDGQSRGERPDPTPPTSNVPYNVSDVRTAAANGALDAFDFTSLSTPWFTVDENGHVDVPYGVSETLFYMTQRINEFVADAEAQGAVTPDLYVKHDILDALFRRLTAADASLRLDDNMYDSLLALLQVKSFQLYNKNGVTLEPYRLVDHLLYAKQDRRTWSSPANVADALENLRRLQEALHNNFMSGATRDQLDLVKAAYRNVRYLLSNGLDMRDVAPILDYFTATVSEEIAPFQRVDFLADYESWSLRNPSTEPTQSLPEDLVLVPAPVETDVEPTVEQGDVETATEPTTDQEPTAEQEPTTPEAPAQPEPAQEPTTQEAPAQPEPTPEPTTPEAPAQPEQKPATKSKGKKKATTKKKPKAKPKTVLKASPNTQAKMVDTTVAAGTDSDHIRFTDGKPTLHSPANESAEVLENFRDAYTQAATNLRRADARMSLSNVLQPLLQLNRDKYWTDLDYNAGDVRALLDIVQQTYDNTVHNGPHYDMRALYNDFLVNKEASLLNHLFQAETALNNLVATIDQDGGRAALLDIAQSLYALQEKGIDPFTAFSAELEVLDTFFDAEGKPLLATLQGLMIDLRNERGSSQRQELQRVQRVLSMEARVDEGKHAKVRDVVVSLGKKAETSKMLLSDIMSAFTVLNLSEASGTGPTRSTITSWLSEVQNVYEASLDVGDPIIDLAVAYKNYDKVKPKLDALFKIDKRLNETIISDAIKATFEIFNTLYTAFGTANNAIVNQYLAKMNARWNAIGLADRLNVADRASYEEYVADTPLLKTLTVSPLPDGVLKGEVKENAGQRESTPTDAGTGHRAGGKTATNTKKGGGKPRTRRTKKAAGDSGTAQGAGTGGQPRPDAGTVVGNLQPDQQDGGTPGNGTEQRPGGDEPPSPSTEPNLGPRSVAGQIQQRAVDGRFAEVIGRLETEYVGVGGDSQSFLQSEAAQRVLNEYEANRAAQYRSEGMEAARADNEAQIDRQSVAYVMGNLVDYANPVQQEFLDIQQALVQDWGKISAKSNLSEQELNAATATIARMFMTLGRMTGKLARDLYRENITISTSRKKSDEVASTLYNSISYAPSRQLKDLNIEVMAQRSLLFNTEPATFFNTVLHEFTHVYELMSSFVILEYLNNNRRGTNPEMDAFIDNYKTLIGEASGTTIDSDGELFDFLYRRLRIPDDQFRREKTFITESLTYSLENYLATGQTPQNLGIVPPTLRQGLMTYFREFIRGLARYVVSFIRTLGITNLAFANTDIIARPTETAESAYTLAQIRALSRGLGDKGRRALWKWIFGDGVETVDALFGGLQLGDSADARFHAMLDASFAANVTRYTNEGMSREDAVAKTAANMREMIAMTAMSEEQRVQFAQERSIMNRMDELTTIESNATNMLEAMAEGRLEDDMGNTYVSAAISEALTDPETSNSAIVRTAGLTVDKVIDMMDGVHSPSVEASINDSKSMYTDTSTVNGTDMRAALSEQQRIEGTSEGLAQTRELLRQRLTDELTNTDVPVETVTSVGPNGEYVVTDLGDAMARRIEETDGRVSLARLEMEAKGKQRTSKTKITVGANSGIDPSVARSETRRVQGFPAWAKVKIRENQYVDLATFTPEQRDALRDLPNRKAMIEELQQMFPAPDPALTTDNDTGTSTEPIDLVEEYTDTEPAGTEPVDLVEEYTDTEPVDLGEEVPSADMEPVDLGEEVASTDPDAQDPSQLSAGEVRALILQSLASAMPLGEQVQQAAIDKVNAYLGKVGETDMNGKMARLVRAVRTRLVDASTPFTDWLVSVFSVEGVDPLDVAPVSSWMQMPARTGAAIQTVQENVLVPIQNWMQEQADQLAMDWEVFAKDMGNYRTYLHTIEASYQQEQILMEEVQNAYAVQNEELRAAAVQKATEALEKYRAYQELGPENAERVPLYGGRRRADCETLLAELDEKYGRDLCMQGVYKIGDGIHWVTQFLAQNGMISRADLERYGMWNFYAPLQTKRDMANDGAHDIILFSPRVNAHRRGSLEPAENAFTNLMAYGVRAGRAVGMQDFGTQLKSVYDTLVARSQIPNGNIKVTASSFNIAYYNGMALISTDQVAKLDHSDADAFRHFAQHVMQRSSMVIRVLEADKDNPGSTKMQGYYVLFDQGNENYKRIGEALRDPAVRDDYAGFTKAFSQGTRLAGSMYTRARPLFPVVNCGRDMGERISYILPRTYTTNSGGTVSGVRIAARMTAFMLNPINGIRLFKYQFSGSSGSAAFDALMAHFQASGLQGANNYSNLVRLGKRQMESQLKRHILPYKVRKALNIPAAPFRAILEFFGNTNAIFYAMPGLAQFQAMLQSDVRMDSAVNQTLTLMNLGQRGTWTHKMSAFYPFVTSIFQTTSNMLGTLGMNRFMFNKQHGRAYRWRAVKSWATLMGLFAAYSMLLPLLKSSFDDDERKSNLFWYATPTDMLTRGLPLGTKNGQGGFISIPNGFGLQQLALTGVVVFDKFRNNKISAGDAALDIVTSFAKTLVPNSAPAFEFSKDPAAYIAHTFSPLLLSPITTLVSGRSYTGAKLTYDTFETGERKSDKLNLQTNTGWRDAAQAIYKYTGIDLAPEEWRAVATEALVGPFSLIIKAVENTPLYSDPHFKNTREVLGPVLTLLGASSLYNAGMNLEQRLYHNAWDHYEKRIFDAGIGHVWRGTADERRRILAQAGFTKYEIDDIMYLYKLQQTLRNEVDVPTKNALKNMDGPNVDKVRVASVMNKWHRTRQAHLKGIQNKLYFYKRGHPVRYGRDGLSEPGIGQLRHTVAGQAVTPQNIALRDFNIPTNNGRALEDPAYIKLESSTQTYVIVPKFDKRGRRLSENDAWDLYLRTGKHFGKYNNMDDAESYKNSLWGDAP